MSYELYKSTRKDKKYMLFDGKTIIHFGGGGYSDYTKHKDDARKERYLSRHKKNENWNKSGLMSAGFLSRWILWNKPTIDDSLKDINDRFNIKIVNYI